ncbi:MAG: carbamoyltransferase HypF [Bacteroidales bacterium]|nr:carbamoyltransferase HypF [Bacteroidales bacterium]
MSLSKLKKFLDKHTASVHVKGLVQGVGFRPFIYCLAKKYKLKGWVENRNDGVVIEVQGNKKSVEKFISLIKTQAPVASNIVTIFSKKTKPGNFSDFQIIKSKNTSDEITDISPDIAVCDECLKDMKIQENRINYPFINCTNCGPRFTIIKDLPYDREKTTMSPFIMCKSCAAEYTDILDRRFHAQPVACSVCGPEYELIYKGKIINDLQKILKIVCELIEVGKIIAIKGLGGFHIACDAQNEEVVKRLRKKKNRDGKPFAVMFSDIKSLKDYAIVNDVHASILQSWRRPIILLNEKKKLAPSVNVGFDTIGAMLPYMPIHYLLFEKLNIPVIVLTSGNISDEPIIIDNEEAKKQLTGISDALLIYNREIYNRTDDSVAMVVNNKERVIRRSRGFTPTPVELKINVDGILATGAELVNCFCIGKGKQAILSQHIGDLKNIETLEFYTETIEQFKKLFRVKPTLIACDKHPDYLSTKYANDLELPKIQIQHHHAHIASCMTEHGLDEKVIGVAFDGIGLGDDNKIWGGEFFVCDLKDYKRITHFDYIPMPGGDKATKNPWRMAVSFLYKFFGKDFLNFNLPFLKNINKKDIDLLLYAIDKNINCPLTSSAGRLFDAVAALTNICTFSTFHAEAPMRLESVMDDNCNKYYDFEIIKTIKFDKTFKGIIDDIKSGTSVSVISAKFHNTIINIIFAVVSEIRKDKKIDKVVLSGGSFQNRYILEKIENLLIDNGFNIYSQRSIPANDGGIALGQLAIAAKRREMVH